MTWCDPDACAASIRNERGCYFDGYHFTHSAVQCIVHLRPLNIRSRSKFMLSFRFIESKNVSFPFCVSRDFDSSF